MPILDEDTYRPRWIFKHRHINTIFPYLFRKSNTPKYNRLRCELDDGDFVDIDTILNGNQRAIFLFHGLEGSTESQYIKSNAALFAERGFDVYAMNHRSCSGEPNRMPTSYHSGFTSDIHHVMHTYGASYDGISAIGFSLGGNAILKYIGDEILPLPNNLNAVAAVSAPIDLLGCSVSISSPENRIYDKNFLKTLLQKMKAKEKDFPQAFKDIPWNKIKRLKDFDEYITGPINGFGNAEGYYTQCSAKQFLHSINIPTLLLQALDDPFLSKESYPYDMAKKLNNIHFLPTKYGGHLGFTTFGTDYYWNEEKIYSFLSKY